MEGIEVGGQAFTFYRHAQQQGTSVFIFFYLSEGRNERNRLSFLPSPAILSKNFSRAKKSVLNARHWNNHKLISTQACVWE